MRLFHLFVVMPSNNDYDRGGIDDEDSEQRLTSSLSSNQSRATSTGIDGQNSMTIVFQCASCYRCLGDSSCEIFRTMAVEDHESRSPTSSSDSTLKRTDVITLSKLSDNIIVSAEKLYSHRGIDKGSVYKNLNCCCGVRGIGRMYIDDEHNKSNGSANLFCLNKGRIIRYEVGTANLITELESTIPANAIKDSIEKIEQMILQLHHRLESLENRQESASGEFAQVQESLKNGASSSSRKRRYSLLLNSSDSSEQQSE